MNRKEQKKATKSLLINSARQVMFEKGIDETQVSDITKTAGVAHGTFYVHFENKNELVRLLINDFNKLLFEKVISAFEENTGNSTTIDLKAIAEIYLNQLRENKNFIRIYVQKYGISLPIDTLYEGFNPPMVTLIAREIDRVAKRDEVEELDSLMLSHAILSMWLRVGIRHVLTEGTEDKSATVSMLCRLTESVLNEFLSFSRR